jgi:hypothetical protein
MCLTQNDNPLSRREVAGLRLRREGQQDRDTTARVGYWYWHHGWKAVAVDPGRLHHDVPRPPGPCGWLVTYLPRI